jgi:hypothetical protein
MAAKIYNAPEELEIPKLDFANFNAKVHKEKEDKYIEDLKQHMRELGYNGKNMGEILRFPAADSYAQYMVVSMRPLQLVHLELGDAWGFQYAHLLTAKEVQQKVDQQKKINELFSQKGK